MGTSPRVFVESSVEQLMQFVAGIFNSVICETAVRHDFCRIALSGGTTPRALYQLLAQNVMKDEVPWDKVQIFFGDERDVPHDNVESNYRMAQRVLLDHLPIEPERVFPMPADREDLQNGAAEYEQTIREIVPAGPNGIPSFDLILLGIGGDGHTASLFPGNAALGEKEKLVVSTFVPVLGRHRMTFTYPLINAAQCVLFIVTGDDKANTMGAILGEDEKARANLPAAGVKPQGMLIYAMDSSAAKYSQFTHKS